MTSSQFVRTTDLRGRFALGLAQLYGSEVPAYNTLVDVSREVNADQLAVRGPAAERLGDLGRVTAERHGAVRVGSPHEIAQLARIFAGFGMYPVGFYDLRNGDGTGVPVVSTAFRPTDTAELARNPFRVFTSMLAVDDARYFDAHTRTELTRFLDARELFSPRLIELADGAARDGGLDADDAVELLALATDAFRLSRTPIDRRWYEHLSAISSVAADIGGVSGTHINHLTPRVLDIAALNERMQARGIEMLDEIQGPPAWDGPDVLLRQTSFRALAERRLFRTSDGLVEQGELRVRFGEVEQRGIALTAAGLRIHERAMTALKTAGQGADSSAKQDLARQIWADSYPRTEVELADCGLAWFAVESVGDERPRAAIQRLTELMDAGLVETEPIVYEDFLPRSAAGIFRSNLTSSGARDDTRRSADYDIDRLADIVGMAIADPQHLYRQQRQQSVRDAQERLACTIVDDLAPA